MTAHRRGQKPDHQQATKRLQDVKQEIEHIMATIKAGIVTASTKAALEQAEAERDALGRFKALLDDLENVRQLQVDRARGLLRVLLGKEIVLHPMADKAYRGW